MTPININLFDELLLCNGININFHRPEMDRARTVRGRAEADSVSAREWREKSEQLVKYTVVCVLFYYTLLGMRLIKQVVDGVTFNNINTNK